MRADSPSFLADAVGLYRVGLGQPNGLGGASPTLQAQTPSAVNLAVVRSHPVPTSPATRRRRLSMTATIRAARVTTAGARTAIGPARHQWVQYD